MWVWPRGNSYAGRHVERQWGQWPAVNKERRGGRERGWKAGDLVIPPPATVGSFYQPISATDRKGKNCHYSIIGRKIKSPGISGGRWLVVHAESGNLIKTKGPPPVHWKKGRDYRANLLRIFLRFTEPSIRFKCREETLPFIGTFSSLHIKL